MATKRIPLHEATRDQLATYAQLYCGVDVEPRFNSQTIRSRIIATDANLTHITIPDDDGPVALQTPQESRAAALPPTGSKRRMVQLMIPETSEPGGNEPVKVGVNGSVMYIPRGKRSAIPYEYYEALQNATLWHFDKPPSDMEPLGERREVPRIPLTVYGIDPVTPTVASA